MCGNMRYSVRDQNGDELAAFHVWAHAAQYLRTWGGEGRVWDTLTDTVQLSSMPEDAPEDEEPDRTETVEHWGPDAVVVTREWSK